MFNSKLKFTVKKISYFLMLSWVHSQQTTYNFTLITFFFYNLA